MTNPLLTTQTLPLFSQIKPENIVPAVEKVIADSKAVIESVLKHQNYTWSNLVQPMDEADNAFTKVWSPISHLNAVKNSPELRKAYEACLPLISNYSTWVSQNKPLYEAYKKLHQSDEFKNLTQSQQKSITNAIRDFELSGIHLDEQKKQRYSEIVSKLSELSASFSNNVLDATMAFTKLITDESKLKGLPQSAIDAAKELAESKNLKGFLFTLDIPSYSPILTYCDDRELRYEMFYAYSTRASEIGPNAGEFDNTENVEQILALRHELANLLNFKSYAHKSLTTKMAKEPQKVIEFLTNLANKAKSQGEAELVQLKRFAYEHYGASELKPWDIAYYSEKQKQHLYSINDEELRAYFPQDTVINGLFEVAHRLFGITIKQRHNVDVWSEEVKFYDVFDKQGEYKASFYLDLYARENKRGGAWMDDCAGQMRMQDGTLQKPVAYLTCNFNRPVGNNPALFTHYEVVTLFHEFGHGLHHMLTEIDVASVSGINGVSWDAVELPSQILENWCYEPEALEFLSSHYQTEKALDKAKIDNIVSAKNYQAALFILRQLEFSLFDMLIHLNYDKNHGARTLAILQQVREQVAVTESTSFGRFPFSFSHIFAGGYAAGYYSYLWAEVLSADAYSRFAKEGIFNAKTGQAFLAEILSQGGKKEPMELFKNFMGREPEISALLNQYGIA